MRFHLCAASLIFAVFASAAAPPPKTPAKTAAKTPAKTAATPIAPPIAPATIPHPMALFLGDLSKSGKEKVSFRASALGTHFFFEEASGVSVYVYDASVGYRKETFLKGAKLAAAVKKYR